MSDALKRLAGPTALGSGTTTVLTVASGNHTYTIREITIVNRNVASVTVKLGINGVADGNLVLPPVPIVSNGMACFSGLIVLATTDTIQVNATDTGITVSIHGLDQL